MKKALLLASVVIALSFSAIAAEKLEDIELAPEEIAALDEIGSELAAEDEVEVVDAVIPEAEEETAEKVELIPALGPNTSYAKKVYDERLPKLDSDFTVIATNAKGRFVADVIVNDNVSNELYEEAFKSKGEYVTGITIAYDSDVILDGKYTLIGLYVAPLDGDNFVATSVYTMLESGRIVRLPAVLCAAEDENNSVMFISVPDDMLTMTDEGYRALPVAFIKNNNVMRTATFGNVDNGFDSMLSSGIITY